MHLDIAPDTHAAETRVRSSPQRATSILWGVLVSTFFSLLSSVQAIENTPHTSYDQFTQQLAHFQKESARPAQSLQTYTNLYHGLITFLEQDSLHMKRFFEESGKALWPSQKKIMDAIIHHVFFPEEAIENIYEAYGGTYQEGHWSLITRSTLTSLTFAATYGADPIALFYLGQAFYHTSLCEILPCPQAGHIYQAALRIFVDTALQADHPLQEVAKYYLAKFYQPLPDYSYLLPRTFSSRVQALKLLSGTSIPAAKFLQLNRRLHLLDTQTTRPAPSFEDFQMLNEQTDYPLTGAIMYDVFSKDMSHEDKFNLLKDLLETKPHPLLHRRLAQIYLSHPEKCNPEKAIKHLKKALNNGSSIAYEQLLSQYAPPTTVFHKFNLSHIADNHTHDLCHEVVETMAHLGYPDAFYHLYVLHKAQVKFRQKQPEMHTTLNQQDDQKTGKRYLIEAARHGFWRVYAMFSKHSAVTVLADYPDLETTREQLYAHVLQSYPDIPTEKYCAHNDLEKLLDAIPDTAI